MGAFQSSRRAHLHNGALVSDKRVAGDGEEDFVPSILRVLEDMGPANWERASPEAVTVTKIPGGVTNLLYRVSCGGLADPVLVRVYGNNTELLIDREEENRTFGTLSRRGLSCHLYGRFRGGRVEQFLDAQPLMDADLRKPGFQALIARELARLHSVPLEGRGATPKILAMIEKWFDVAEAVAFEDAAQQRELASIDLRRRRRDAGHLVALLERMRASPSSEAERFATEMVFGHQDLLAGNILHNDAWDRVQFIDFEYAGPNFRLYDHGNHFVEFAGLDGGDDMDLHYPDGAAKAAPLRLYCAAVRGEEPAEAFVAELARIVDLFAMASHCAWGAWSVVQARYSVGIDFDFLRYAKKRWAGFDKRRAVAQRTWPDVRAP